MMPPALRGPAKFAVFLDFDGTLVEIAANPDLVMLSETTRQTLLRLMPALDGALAIVTGREIATIDRHLAPLRVPIAGVHGLMRRDAAGCYDDIGSRSVEINAFGKTVDAALAQFLRAHPDLLLEHKHGAVALHFRAAPDQAAVCLAMMQAIAAGLPGSRLCSGKHVVELVAGPCGKGAAVAAYLAEVPFHGRVPIFIGDDATDEDAFAVVNRAGGVSIKVGSGPTVAQQRLADPDAVRNWLSEMAVHLDAVEVERQRHG